MIGTLAHPGELRRYSLVALNAGVRLAIIYWLVEAWVFQDDPRFADKAIPLRNTLVVGSLSMLFPVIWYRRGLSWSTYPIGLDIVYLSIFALDMAGNSLDLYERSAHFDLIPHLHGPGAFSLIISVYWARTRYPTAPFLPDHRWLVESTLIGTSIATTVHVVMEAQEYYTDVVAGTTNVQGIADTVNDLVVGIVGALVYPPLAIRWFLPGRVRIGLMSVATVVDLAALGWIALFPLGPLLTDFAHDRVATPLPATPMSAEVRENLLTAARAGREARSAPTTGELHNAHFSATPDELMSALTGGFQSIEGDVGMTGETPVMRHDPRDPVEMTFIEWLEIVSAADFAVVKIDVKRDKIGPIIADLRTATQQFGLRESSLILNADVLRGPAAYGDLNWMEQIYNRAGLELEEQDLVELAAAFPSATISIGLATGRVAGGGGYRADDVREVRDLAERVREAGASRVVVAARWDLLTVEFMESMIQEGIVMDIWNSVTILSPADPEAEAARLRARYGDALGTIDLRR